MLDDALMTRTTGEWIEQLSRQGAGVAPVYDVAQALDNPFVAERGGVLDFAYPDGRAARR